MKTIALLIAALTTFPAFSRAAEIRVASSILSVSETIEAPAPEAGLLHELGVREGSRVAAGKALGRVDPREARFAADLVKNDLSIATRESQSDVRVRLAEAENKVAKAELGRATSVNADLPNTVSDKEIDRLRLAVDRTELEIEHARFERELLGLRIGRIEADLRLAEHRVERLAIVSPIAGVVSELHKHAGEWVDKGEPVARIVRVDRLRAEGFVAVDDAMLGLIGRPVVVRATLADGSPVEASGRVVFVSPEAEPVNSQVRFWAEIDNASLSLRPGLTASVTILDTPATASPREARR